MKNSKYFKYYQPNEKDIKDKQGDCAIRGLTKFYDISWLDAFDKLVVYARRNQVMINGIDNIKELLQDDKVEYETIYKQKKSVSDFTSEHKQGKYLLYVRVGFGTHIVAVENGLYYDTWDCGKKLVYGYWKK